MERSKQNKHIVGDKDDGVDNSFDDSNDGASKHITYLSWADGFCLMKRSKQNTCVDDDNGDGVDNSDDSGVRHLTHLVKTDDCCLMERSKQI
eukprot:5213622-Ditylum_brightwellii.AAC.1